MPSFTAPSELLFERFVHREYETPENGVDDSGNLTGTVFPKNAFDCRLSILGDGAGQMVITLRDRPQHATALSVYPTSALHIPTKAGTTYGDTAHQTQHVPSAYHTPN
jgi:hypothetical protein